jgi:hypothetical protein
MSSARPLSRCTMDYRLFRPAHKSQRHPNRRPPEGDREFDFLSLQRRFRNGRSYCRAPGGASCGRDLPIQNPANPSCRSRADASPLRASCARPADRRRRAIAAAILGTFRACSSCCSMKASTSPRASAISVSARRTALTRERSAISSAYIGPEDDQPISTRSFSGGFVTRRFDRQAAWKMPISVPLLSSHRTRLERPRP